MINNTWFFIRLNILYLLLIIYNKIIDAYNFFLDFWEEKCSIISIKLIVFVKSASMLRVVN
jgi:hypothetical protein